MVSFDEFANELRAFDNRKVIKNQIRRDLRKPLPALLKQVRASALAILPARGGLGSWVAKARATVQLRDAGRSAGIRLKLSRKAGDGDKADLLALDRTGQVRHPLYGNRSRWFGQTVPARFFSAVWDRYAAVWIKQADESLDKALEVIRRG